MEKRFCKIGLQNTLFIFGRKLVVCCLFSCVLLVAILCPILAKYFLNVSSPRAEKDAVKLKYLNSKMDRSRTRWGI